VAVADVDSRAQQRRCSIPLDAAGGDVDPADRATPRHQALFVEQRTVDGLTAHQRGVEGTATLPILGAQQLPGVERQQLVAGVPGDRPRGGVHVEHTVLALDEDRGRGGFRQRPEHRLVDAGCEGARVHSRRGHGMAAESDGHGPLYWTQFASIATSFPATAAGSSGACLTLLRMVRSHGVAARAR
jgi:hypothetical protein